MTKGENIVGAGVVSAIVPILTAIFAVIGGIILAFCWNNSIAEITTISRMSYEQGIIVGFAASVFSHSTIISTLELSRSQQSKKKVNVGVIIAYAIISVIIFIIGVSAVKYTWNTFIPEMFGYQTTPATWWNSFFLVFVYRFIIPSKPRSSSSE